MSYRIFIHVGEISSCGYYRSVLPALHLYDELQAADIDIIASNKLDESVRYDAYIFGRMPNPQTFMFALKQYRRGTKIIWDLDDDFPSIPDWSPLKPEFGPVSLNYLQESLAMADKVTCSTRPLAESTEAWCPFTKGNVHVLENLVYPDPYFKHGRSQDLTTILWTGSSSHVGDLGPLHAVAEFVTRNPGFLLILMGYFPPEYANAKNIVHIPWWHKMYYEQVLSKMAPDIALLPLLDCPFNRCKSAIKFFECTMAGGLCIASNTRPYSDVIEDQITGFVLPHGDVEQWTAILRDWKEHDQQDIDDMRKNAVREVQSEFSWTSDCSRRRAWRDFFISLAK